jgi:hypothetical protein
LGRNRRKARSVDEDRYRRRLRASWDRPGAQYHARGDDVVVLSRNVKPAPWKTVAWDGRTTAHGWTGEIEGADVVINLAGRNVNCR